MRVKLYPRHPSKTMFPQGIRNKHPFKKMHGKRDKHPKTMRGVRDIHPDAARAVYPQHTEGWAGVVQGLVEQPSVARKEANQLLFLYIR